jgi:chemotaxis protein CheC
MDHTNSFDDRLVSLLRVVANDGVHHAIEGLSTMVGKQIMTANLEVNFVPIFSVPEMVGGPENEVVTVYLQAEGDMAGQFLLIVPTDTAFQLIDLLMDEPAGTTQELDRIGMSALAEVGNLTGSFFLNAVAKLTGLETKPTPPSVIVDMVGAIINAIVGAAAAKLDQMVIINSNFKISDQVIPANFWYIPEPEALQALADAMEKK